jgi:signal transduction histidine kinase
VPIRIRVALVFVTALAIAFGLGGWLFYTRLSASLLGVSLEDSTRTLGSATHGLLIGGAAFLMLAGIGAYWLARAALAPVERMRREAAALSDEDAGSILQVPRTHDEIAALAATMNDLLVRLRTALARQRAFAADASHELRTPIAVLAGELELANRPGRSRAELAAAVAVAGEEVTRLARITDDLLVLARGDEDKLVIEPELTDIHVLLARSAERASSRAAAAGLVCRVEAPAGLVARADPVRIGQAVDNLVSNALRFAPRGTDIVLSGERSGCWLVLEVRDRGPGFPPDFLPHAFERFRRPERDRARGEGGAGLGLAIVRAIVLAHGGRVAARNRPAGGAAVRLEIPAGQ